MISTTSAITKSSVPQPKLIPSVAWSWGFEDGAKGLSEFTGHGLFAGRQQGEYRRGWTEGRRLSRRCPVRIGVEAAT